MGSRCRLEETCNAGSWFQGVRENYLCTVLLNFVAETKRTLRGDRDFGRKF